MIVRTLVILLFISLGFASNAQDYDRVSGFMGHRLALSVGGGLGLSSKPQKQSTEYVGDYDEITLNKYWQADLQFAIKPYINLGVRYGGCQTSAIIDDESNNNYYQWGESVGSDREHKLIRVNGRPGIKGTHVGVFVRQFLSNKGALAPIGAYYGAGVNQHTYDYDFSSVVFVSRSHLGLGEVGTRHWLLEDPISSGKYYEYFVELGKVIPFSERLAGDFSVKLAWLHIQNTSSSDDTQLEEMLRDPIRDRIQGFNILNYSFKLAYLL
jgi:hypothetical protein